MTNSKLCLCTEELIKKHELEKDELRPLYMDFQATTPMVIVTYIVNYSTSHYELFCFVGNCSLCLSFRALLLSS